MSTDPVIVDQPLSTSGGNDSASSNADGNGGCCGKYCCNCCQVCMEQIKDVHCIVSIKNCLSIDVEVEGEGMEHHISEEGTADHTAGPSSTGDETTPPSAS